MKASVFREKYLKSLSSSPGRSSAPRIVKAKRLYHYPAWTWFARYIKILHCDKQGIVRCATSGRLYPVSSPKLHAGHCIRIYEGRQCRLNVAFDRRNVFPQAAADNRFVGGKPEVMRDRVDEHYGEGTYQALLKKSEVPKFYSDAELKALAIRHRKMTYELLEEKDLKKWW